MKTRFCLFVVSANAVLLMGVTQCTDEDLDEDGWTISEGDCNDSDPEIHPGAEEICDGVDQDCDGEIDEDLPVSTYYLDEDGDGYGTSDFTTTDCAAPDGYVTISGDCDDGDETSNPGEEENYLDEIDHNCDGYTTPEFYWSYSGVISDMYCTWIYEAADPNTWDDNYLCSPIDHEFVWSSAGPVSDMTCTQILEGADSHTWDDNYLCVPTDSTLELTWHSAGRPSTGYCVQWLEPSDPDTWDDNFLCHDVY